MVLGRYEIYLIFRLDRSDVAVGQPAPPDGIEYLAGSSAIIAADPSSEIREQAWYGGDGALLFVARERGVVLGTIWCWYGERYARRGFIDLRPDEVKIVHVYTRAAARGRGVGSGLLRYACAELLGDRFRSILARVWLTNRPSRRMFVGAGFRPTRLVIVVRPWPLRRDRRFELGAPFVLRRLAER